MVVLASWIVPGVAGGIVWQLMFNEASYGFLNGILRAAALPPVAWLSDPDLAIWSAVLANGAATAFSMILLYAGLVVIPASLYEAAEVDGANAFQQFRYITLPQLRPILLINTILISIFTLNTFDLILPLTGGGLAAPPRSWRSMLTTRFFETWICPTAPSSPCCYLRSVSLSRSSTCGCCRRSDRVDFAPGGDGRYGDLCRLLRHLPVLRRAAPLADIAVDLHQRRSLCQRHPAMAERPTIQNYLSALGNPDIRRRISGTVSNFPLPAR